MRPSHLFGVGCAAALTACATPAPETPVFGCTDSVTAYGSRAELREAPDIVAVMLANVDRADTMVGYGPNAGYLSELTLVDGVWQIAHRNSAETVRVETTSAPQAGAVFLVTDAPRAWITAPLDSAIADMADLESHLLDISAASPCPNAPLPFKLTGVITESDWSAVGRPAGAKGRLASADVTLVGIFDPVDQDRYFTPSGHRVPVHLLIANGTVSGHLAGFTAFDAAMLITYRIFRTFDLACGSFQTERIDNRRERRQADGRGDPHDSTVIPVVGLCR